MTLLVKELIDPRTMLLPIRVEQYHEMMKKGIIEEGAPFELLDGAIVRKDRSAHGEDPMTVGNEHIYAVMALLQLMERLKRRGCHMRVQSPILIPPINEPEPDGTVVYGSIDEYAHRLPTTKDIACVIEVSDASLRRDRTTKMEIYARAGITRHLIVNLLDRCVEVYSEPQRRKGIYAQQQVYSAKEKVEIPAGGRRGVSLAVSKLFPKTVARRRRSAS